MLSAYLNGMITEDIVLEYLDIRMVEQGRKSVHYDDKLKIVRCSYRGDGGCKDTIGMLIPDDLYLPEMDLGNHTSVCYLVAHFKDHLGLRENIDPKFLKMRVEFLQDLQMVHDSIRQEKKFYKDDLRINMRQLRFKWGLMEEGTEY